MSPIKPNLIQFFALTEICIGGFTFFSTIFSLFLHTSTKPFNVLIFVFATSIISFFLGVGLLFKKSWAAQLLLYFAFSIILTKILIFAKIIYLNGHLETNIPEPIKNSISIIYHCLILWFFNQKCIQQEFKETD
ncbi:MAG: hypothetical protein AB1629_03135 [Candidatus Omnitrophota bacterium]